MVDIHTHILPLVDDGSASFETSLAMLKSEIEQGVTDIILTPHYRKDYKLSPEKLREEFLAFCEKVKQNGIDINLYLGQEIMIDKKFKSLFVENMVLPIGQTKFVLIEFSERVPFDISEAVYVLSLIGYTPIIAHIERYKYADMDMVREIKDLGGLIQVNADSLVGKGKFKYARKVKNLISEGLVDFVASDIHAFRKNTLKKCANYVSKKFGQEVYEKLFINSAQVLIEKN